MVLCSFPMTAIAETLESVSIEETAEATNEDDEKWHLVGEDSVTTGEMIGAVSEVESLREENVKHFSLPDGTYEAVVYTQAVHRKDKNGVWQDIDNTIELSTDAKLSKYSTQDLRVSFADRFTANSDLFTLSENGYSISMKLLNDGIEFDDQMETTDFGAFDTPTVNNSSKKRVSNVFNSLDEAKNIDNRSSIVYNGIRKNTDIEYVLQGNDVKENIIINAPCKSYEYTFEITLDGLVAELNENGEIFIKDINTNEIEYVIPAPYMYDADGNYSYNVSYALERVKDEIYLLAVTADSEWINAEDRAFPVVVDPTIHSDKDFYYDTYLDANSPNENFGRDPLMWVSNSCTALIKVGIPELPKGSAINEAWLYVPYMYHITTGSLLAGAYDVSTYWNEYNATYNTSPTINSKISSAVLYASQSAAVLTPGVTSFDITNTVINWYNGTPNFGIAIKREASSVHTNLSVLLETCELSNKPTYLSINYESILLIDEGEYFIQNAQSQKYITSDYYDGTQSLASQNIGAGQWTYDNANYQRWKIEYTDSSCQYITIYSSKYSGGYLGVVQNNSTKIKQYTTINDYCTWKIEKTRKGNFKFTCKAFENTNNVLAMPSSNANGVSLIRTEYTESDNTDYDEWYLIKKVITMVNYYDDTYYDDTQNSSQLELTYIDQAVSFANLVYSRYFNVGINMYEIKYEVTADDLGISECRAFVDNSPYYPCTTAECGSICNNHHKNVHVVSDKLLNYVNGQNLRRNNYIYTLWTDYPANTFCKSDSQTNEHTLSGAVATVCNYLNSNNQRKPVIHFLQTPNSGNNKMGCMAWVLIHEIAHIFGLEEVYEDRSDHEDNTALECVMKRYMGNDKTINTRVNNINSSNKNPFCTYCTSSIKNKAQNLNIS